MAFSDDLDTVDIILVFGGVAGLAYLAYWIYQNLGGGAADPGGGAPSTGILSALDNQLEIGASSLSQSDATQQFLSNPFSSLGTILKGWWDDLTGGGGGSSSVDDADAAIGG